jgi:hypothetical protein
MILERDLALTTSPEPRNLLPRSASPPVSSSPQGSCPSVSLSKVGNGAPQPRRRRPLDLRSPERPRDDGASRWAAVHGGYGRQAPSRRGGHRGRRVLGARDRPRRRSERRRGRSRSGATRSTRSPSTRSDGWCSRTRDKGSGPRPLGPCSTAPRHWALGRVARVPFGDRSRRVGSSAAAAGALPGQRARNVAARALGSFARRRFAGHSLRSRGSAGPVRRRCGRAPCR